MKIINLSSIANPISISVQNPSRSDYDRFIGLEHYDSGEPVITRFQGTELLTTSAKAFKANDILITRVRDNILKSKEQKNIQPTKGGHKMVTCQNYVSLFYRQITSCPSDGGIS